MRYLWARLGRLAYNKLGVGRLKSLGYSVKDITGKALNPIKTIKAFGQLQKEQIKRNPFIQKLMSADAETKEYAEAFQRMSEEELPSMQTLRVFGEILGVKDPKKVIDIAINNPKRLENAIKTQTNAKKEKIRQAIESDTNEAPLSSSWLAYGTYVSLKNNPDRGELYLTTKTGAQFKTPPVTLGLWNKMKKQIGVTVYKNGKRSGASFGAGTILHKYVPRSKWRKVTNPEEIKKNNPVKETVKNKVASTKKKLTPTQIKLAQKEYKTFKKIQKKKPRRK